MSNIIADNGRITFEVDAKLKAALNKYTKKHGTSMTWVLTKLVEQLTKGEIKI